MLSEWHVTGIESGKVFKSLQKYIIRIAKKQGQFQKLSFEKLTKRNVTGIETGKVLKSLQKYIIRIANKQGHFLKLCFIFLSKCHMSSAYISAEVYH